MEKVTKEQAEESAYYLLVSGHEQLIYPAQAQAYNKHINVKMEFIEQNGYDAWDAILEDKI